MRLTAICVALALSGCASKLETTFHALHAIDALQTLEIANSRCYEERNPITRQIIGRNPSELDVVLWWAGRAVLHQVVGELIEDRPRWWTAWQLVSIGGSAATVFENHRIGVRIGKANNPSPDHWCSIPTYEVPDAEPEEPVLRKRL